MSDVGIASVESSNSRFTRPINAQNLRRIIFSGHPLLQFAIRQSPADHRTRRNHRGYENPPQRAGFAAALPHNSAQPRNRRGGLPSDYRRASVQRMSIMVSDTTDSAKRRRCGS